MKLKSLSELELNKFNVLLLLNSLNVSEKGQEHPVKIKIDLTTLLVCGKGALSIFSINFYFTLFII